MRQMETKWDELKRSGMKGKKKLLIGSGVQKKGIVGFLDAEDELDGQLFKRNSNICIQYFRDLINFKMYVFLKLFYNLSRTYHLR